VNLTLHVWKQTGDSEAGAFKTYQANGVSEHMSFLEMLDMVNEGLESKGEDPVTFDHDCREGICGTCGFVINGHAHGPDKQATICQTHMRSFKDGDELWLEPFRAKAFPVIKDLMVDRSAMDRVIEAGGFISANTGSAPDAHATPVPKLDADDAFNAAACIGCGACVAACPNAAAMLFASAKISHLGLLPQGQPQRLQRAMSIVDQLEAEGFGGCTNFEECAAVCPKGISLDFIARLNRDVLQAKLRL